MYTINQITTANGYKLPTKKQLSMVYQTTDYLCTSEMLKMYKSWGMTIKNLSWALEYRQGYPLKKFVTKVTEKRIQATKEKDQLKQALWKLCCNSSYGRLGMLYSSFSPIVTFVVSKNN